MPSLDELWGLFICWAAGFAVGCSHQAPKAVAEREELRGQLLKLWEDLYRAQAESSVLRVALSETAAELTQVKADLDALRGERAGRAS